MTLEDNKKIALGIIEEYSKGNINLTDDEDISNRLNLAYATSYQELSQIKKILKTKILKESNNEISTGYEEYSLPSNLYQIKRIIALDENNNMVKPDYYTLGKKIYISNNDTYQYILEYFIYPTVINEETSNEFMLELDQDAQMLLPWAVAKDILKTDPSSDYSAFLTEYQRRLESLSNMKELPSVVVEEGVL